MIVLAKRFTEEVFHKLAADGLKETTEITQTETRLKQEDTAQELSVAKTADNRVEEVETTEKHSARKIKQEVIDMSQQQETERVLVEIKKSQETTKILQKGVDKKQSIVRIRQFEQNILNVIIKNDHMGIGEF